MTAFLEGNSVRRSGGPAKSLKTFNDFTNRFKKSTTVPTESEIFLEHVWQGSYKNVDEMLSTNKQLATIPNTFESAPLAIAVHCGYDDISRLLITKGGADVNIIGEKGDNLLHIASKWSTTEMLIHFGVNINHQNNWGNSPLQQACYCTQNSEIVVKVEGLINLGADCLTRDKAGGSCLHDIVLHHDNNLTHLIKKLITNGCDVNALDCNGYSPLNNACISTNLPAVRTLLSYSECNVNVLTKHGRTPLTSACCFDWYEKCDDPHIIQIIQVLLENGASANITDNLGSSPLLSLLNCYYFYATDVYATNSNQAESVKTQAARDSDNNFAERKTDQTNTYDNYDSADYIVSAPPGDTKVAGEKKICELYSIQNRPNMAILSTGNDDGPTTTTNTDLKPNNTDDKFNTNESKEYIETKYLSNLFAIIDLLLKYGSNINHSDLNGFTALHWATGKINSRALTKFLLERGAKADAADRWGTQPIHYAAMADDLDMFDMLLEKGASLFSLDKSRSNIFHYAAWSEIHPNELLYEQDDAINQLKLNENNDNLTPLDLYKCFKLDKKLCKMVGNIMLPPNLREHYKELYPLISGGRQFATRVECFTEESFESYFGADMDTQNDSDSEISDVEEDMPLTYPPDLKSEMFPFASNPDKERILYRLLNSPQIGIMPDNKDVRQVRSDLLCLMKRLANLIGLLDSRFKCEPILSGSSNEGTKCTFPNEFDFLFVMSNLNTDEICNVTDGTNDGYVKLYRKSNITQDMEIFFNNYGFLEMQRFKDLFQNVCLIGLCNNDIWKDLNLCQIGYREKDNPAQNIYLEFRGESMKVLTVSVDIVAAIRINNIPKAVRIGNLPCLSEDLYRNSILAVSKTGFSESGQLSSINDFRLSFSILETRILEWAPREALNAYILAKILISSNVFRLSFRDLDFDKVCNSYLLKTALFYTLEKEEINFLPADNYYINMSIVIEWARKLFEHLLESAYSSSLPSYFVPGYSITYRSAQNAKLDKFVPGFSKMPKVLHRLQKEDSINETFSTAEETIHPSLDGIDSISFMQSADYYIQRGALVNIATACLLMLQKNDDGREMSQLFK